MVVEMGMDILAFIQLMQTVLVVLIIFFGSNSPKLARGCTIIFLILMAFGLVIAGVNGFGL